MSASIVELLTSLYGTDQTRRTQLELDRLIARHWGPSSSSGTTRSGLGLSERDALLIAYADQVTESGVPPLRSLRQFCQAHLRDLVSGIHVLPFYPSSSDDGFSVKDYLAVDPEFGDWGELQALREDFDLMVDAVVNHASAQGEWFQAWRRGDPAHRDFFIEVEGNPDLSRVVRPRVLPLLTEFPTAGGVKRLWTTFSADQVDLNFRNPRVLLAVLEVLLFYVGRGARFIRLDAIAFLWKEVGTPCLHRPQTHAIIQLIRCVLDRVAPDVLLITETNVPHADNVSYFGDGTNEAQLVYNFALPPLVLHSFATGSAQKLTEWARALSLPSDQVTFFNFLASHDGIGLNPARGILSDGELDALVERTRRHGGFVSCKSMPDGSSLPYELNINFLDALSDPASGETIELAARKLMTAHAILLSLQGMPGIYFHSLFGSRGDPAGVEASGMPRRINREKLDRKRLMAEMVDANSLRARVFRGMSELLARRRRHPGFAPSAVQRVLGVDSRVVGLVRETTSGEAVCCLHNVSREPVSLPSPQALVGSGRSWQRLHGDLAGSIQGDTVRLGPYGCLWLEMA